MEGALVLMSWTALGMSQGALIGVDERKAVVTADGRSWVRLGVGVSIGTLIGVMLKETGRVKLNEGSSSINSESGSK